MAGLWYRVGTVTLTNGSKAVVGYGTKWKSANPLPGKGSMLCGPDGKVYEVDTVADDNNLTLVSNYTGTSGAGQGYALVLMALTIPQFSTQLSQFVQKNSLFASQINTLLTATGDVNLTDPDSGLVIKVPSWSKIASEGEGQAARAKVEADRSRDEANRAKDEADKAAGIVAAAALPLPDVWAPLSDSLRLITGYGRDVLVGSDVVARMVNFSRNSTATYIGKDGQLKTAAANEPRFEKEGLLIEGQSTNLFLNSENVAVWANPPAASASTRELQAVQGGLVTCKVTATSVNGGVRQTYNSPAGGIHTVSFYLSKNSQSLKFLLENGGAAWGEGAQAAIAPATGTITVVAGITAAKSIPFLAGYIYQLTLPAGKVGGILNAEWRLDAAGDMYIGMPQLEALPFASSYIPTAGAAVTRAADVCWIPMAGNSNNRMSFALTISGFKPVGAGVTSRALWYEDNPFQGPYLGIRYRDGEIVGAHGATATATAYSSGLSGLPAAVIAISPGVKSRTGQYTATQKADSATLQVSSGNLHIGSFKQAGQELWGHARNLRIWHKSLTEDQIKAIA